MVAGFLGAGLLFLTFKTENFLVSSLLCLVVALLVGVATSFFWSQTKKKREGLVRTLKAVELVCVAVISVIFFGVVLLTVSSGKLFPVTGIYFIVLAIIGSSLSVLGFIVSRK